MLKRKNQETDIISDRNSLSTHTKIKGDITAQGIFRIDGCVEGNISIQGRLILGVQSKVQGNIIADSLEIEGFVEGDCHVKETLSLKQTANVKGNIAYGNISIDLGAQFEGNSKLISTINPDNR